MGLTLSSFGLYGGFASVTFPSMLAAEGVPGGKIAAIVATILTPGFFTFLLAPMLDLWLPRRTYAVILTVLPAVAIAFTVTHITQVQLVTGVMLAGFLACSLLVAAIGGWMGSLIRKKDDSKLAAWMGVANTAGSGVMMAVAGAVVTRLHPQIAASVLAGMILLPMLIFPMVPAPGPDAKLASERYAEFFRELFALLTQRRVQIAMLLFVLPSSSFALTNVLGGIGADFSANERLVGLLGGAGAVAAGSVGSLLLPPLARKFALRPLYLGIGVTGALFTLSLLLLPRVPWTFAAAIAGENLFQSLANAAMAAIIFETMGPESPFAATLFSLLLAGANFAIFYMSIIDGRAYTWRGVTGSFAVDAAVSTMVAFSLGAAFIWRRGRQKSTLQESLDYAVEAGEFAE